MQESGYNLSAKNCYSGIPHDLPVSYEVTVCRDFGISQIYYKTAESYGIDRDRLLTDLEYSVDSGAKVLSWFHKTYSHKEHDWYTRYNCGTAPTTNRVTCQDYKRLVLRYM